MSTGLSLSKASDVMKFANTLKEFIAQQKLSEEIQGKQYVLVDGWKFAGMNFGLVPIVTEPEKMSGEQDLIWIFKENAKYQGKSYKKTFAITANKDQKEVLQDDTRTKEIHNRPLYKYKCSCELKNTVTGEIMGTGFAMCSNEEIKKASFDEYAIASMAQTRAIGKAYRNLLGFVMNAAGFETTPAEEMDEVSVPEEQQQEHFTEQDQQDIDNFSDEDNLMSWAVEQEHLAKNETFRKAVVKKRDEIRKEGE